MAEARLQILLDLEDKVSGGLGKVKTGLGNFQDQVKSLEPAFKGMALAGTAGFAAITGAVALSVKESMQAEAAQMRLSHILKTSRGATDDQINALLRQADALEKVGVVSGDSIVQAQAQLATFDLQSESIEKLIPSILDYVVAEKGAAATTEDLKGLTNGLAQALQGNFASLTKTGFVLDDATKALIQNGTEAERTAALVDVLNSTYEGFNAAARETTEGSLIAMRNEFGKLKETIGNQFLPIISQLATKISPVVRQIAGWIEENPKLARNLIIIAAAVSGLIGAIGVLGLMITPIMVGFGAMATMFGILLGPVGLVILAIGALVAAGVLLYKNWETIRNFAVDIWTQITDTIANGMLAAVGVFTSAWETIKQVFWTAVNFIIGAYATLFDFLVPGWDTALVSMWAKTIEIFTNIQSFISEKFSAIKEWISGVLAVISENWSAIWNAVKEVFASIWDSITGIFTSASNAITEQMNKLAGPIERVIQLAERARELAGGVARSVGGAISGGITSILNRGSSLTGRALGGPVSGGTSYLVGERGPELFTPTNSGRVIPNGALAGAGGPQFNITISGNTLLDRDAARKIGDEMVRYLKVNLKI